MIPIFLVTFFIFCFGLLNLLGIRPNLALWQLGFFFEGLILFLLVKKVGRQFFMTNSKFFYWLFIFFLVVVLFLAEDVRGSRRWLNFSFINFQPSEFFKIFFIIYLANFLTKARSLFNQREKFFSVLGLFFLPAVLIFKQPDLGTTLVLTFIFLAMTFVSDIPKKYFFRLFLMMLVFFPLSWFIMKPYQRVRLISFINPHLDKQGTAYNLIQSIIAIGSGGFFGKGLGLGTQAKLFFLPENYTDFAFASFIEQFGLLGGLILLTLFLILFYFLVKKIYNFTHFNYPQAAVDFYYTLGFLVMIFSQVVINMGMNLGLLPVTGITLPLISYGGSSLASFMLGLALLP